MDIRHQVRVADPLYESACRVVLDQGKPSISLLIRSFAIGYSHSERLIRAMEDDVIAEGELDRYTAYLRAAYDTSFDLKTLPAAA